MSSRDHAPEPGTDLVATAQSAGKFATLLTAARTAGLAATLRQDGPWTILAPTDAAFDRLPAGALEGLLANPAKLREVLLHHVLEGRQSAGDLVAAGSARSRGGPTLPIAIQQGWLIVGGVRVIDTDITASNGTIHVLDAVLLPTPKAAPSGVAGEFTAAKADDIRATRALAADRLERALDDELQGEALARAATEVAATLDDDAIRERLTGTAALDQDDLERLVESVISDLRFEPLIQAPLPAGWPPVAPLDQVVLKSYPRYRMAVAPMAGEPGMSRTFFQLFNHIKDRDIAMTAPVQMDMAETERGSRTEQMGFMYRTPDMGQLEHDGAVEVIDIPAALAISVGARGNRRNTSIDELTLRLEAWLEAHADRFERAGALRVMGYNDPMVPASRQFYEVEIPVREIAERPAAVPSNGNRRRAV